MILLTCGVPGAGKTLWTLATVEARRVAEARKVFYSGIPQLSLEWEELPEGADWDAVPDGSIIVIDECQRIFPLRRQGSPVPDSVRRMETHRHRGLDLYLISQNPLQLDTAVRHLVGEYRFLVRPFGHAYSVVWRFGHVCDWKSTVEQQKADKVRWKFPKESFGWYKSAEVHTHKKSFPRAALLILPLAVVIGGAIWLVYSKLASHGGSEKKTNIEANNGAAAAVAGDVATEARTPGQIADSVLAYVQARAPRVRELPESAPVYDSLAVPVTFPRVAACTMAKGKVCRCYTQQGTPLSTLDAFCVEFVKHGAFDPYRAPLREGAAGDLAASEGTGRGAALSGKTKRTPLVVPLGGSEGKPLPAKPGSEVIAKTAQH